MGRAHDCFRIHRLQRVQIEDPGLVAEIRFQDPCRPHRLGHHGPAGNDGQVFMLILVLGLQHGFEGFNEIRLLSAEADHIGLAEHERRLFVGHNRGSFARKPDVLWPNVLQQQVVRRLAGLDDVAGHDHVHIG